MGQFSFRREERLKKEKYIQELFSKGSSFHLYPFTVLYLPANVPEASCHQTLFSVSARNFKRAVDRNKIKRRTREAFRLNKHELKPDPKLWIGLVYTAKTIEPYETVLKAVKKLVVRIDAMATTSK